MQRMTFVTVASFLVCVSAEASPRTELAAKIAYAVVTASESPSPAPDNKPPSEVCDECGGKGWVGDGSVKMKCPLGCPASKNFSAPPPPQIRKPAPVSRQTSTRWSIGSQSYRTATTQQIADHLRSDHGIDPTGYDRDSMLNIHDNAHAGASCPTGTCPRK